MSKSLLLMTCATGALTLMAGAAQAATATASAGSSAATTDNTTNVTELVVTAEKREQSLQKVPVAVSVFTGAERDTIGINTVADVTNFAPGFTYDPGNVHAFIRGIGRTSVNVTDDQRVANYEDEFYVYSPYGLDKSSLFLSQEQIERGPQNVGGRNAAAGSIDMISVRPTDQPYGEIRATVANFGTYNIEGAFSTQVAPGLDVRIAAFDHNQDDGFYHNLMPGLPSEGSADHEWYVEGQADYKPNDKFEFWMRAFAEGWDNRGDAGSRLGFDSGGWNETTFSDANDYVAGGLFWNPTYGYSAPNGNPAAHAAVTAPGAPAQPIVTNVDLYVPGILNNPSSAANSNVFISPNARVVKLNGYDDFNYIASYHFDGFDFRYTGGVQGYNYYLTDPTDGPAENNDVKSFTLLDVVPGQTPLTIFPRVTANYVEDDWWTAHDFTLLSTTGDPLQWQGGLFYYFQHYNQPYDVADTAQPQLTAPVCLGAVLGLGANSCGASGGLNALGLPLAASNVPDYIGYFDYKFNVETVSPYAQVSYKLNDQWKVTGDIRYTWDDKWGTENARYISDTSLTMNPVAAAGGLPLYEVAGAGTPSADVTALVICATGVATSCNSGPLASGVTSKGVILSNGFAQRGLGIVTSAVTGGFDLDWTPTPDIFTYFRYGRGYESPSFNAGQVIAAPVSKPEYLNSYEVGYKQSFGKALLVDIAAFYYDYDDMETPFSIANAGVTQSLFINVPSAISTGVEVEAYWTPVTDLLVTTSYSYDYTAVETGCSGTVKRGVLTPAPGALCLIDTNDPDAVEPGATPFPGQTAGATRDQSVKGNPLLNAPENKFAVDVAYTWRFTPGSLTLSGTYAYRGSQASALFDRSYNIAPSWDDVDFRMLWKGPGDRYELIGFIKNAFNTLQYTVGGVGAGLGGGTAINPAATGFNEVTAYELNPPRTYGLEVRYKFF
jgi:iron complex outermembrane recepter protein